MAKSRKKRRDVKGMSETTDGWVDWFEKEYARIERQKGIEAAKAFFRQHVAVTCFACGCQGRPIPPLNCARCGQYLD